jgi:hypothetical protein
MLRHKGVFCSHDLASARNLNAPAPERAIGIGEISREQFDRACFVVRVLRNYECSGGSVIRKKLKADEGR